MILRQYIILAITGLFTIFIINVYFMKLIESSKLNLNHASLLPNKVLQKKNIHSQLDFFNSKLSTMEFMQENVNKRIKLLPKKYFKKNVNFIRILEQILVELKLIQNRNNDILRVLKNWTSARHLIPSFSPELGTIIELLRQSDITKADTAKVGTQLKLILTFKNGLRAVFKPQWYNRTTKIIGPVYYGKDRHNAEVVAFYLALLLSLRRVPLALIRKCKNKQLLSENGFFKIKF